MTQRSLEGLEPIAQSMRAMTFIQPWGSAAMMGVKPVENRPFAPPKWLIGNRFAVHAGKKFDRDDAWGLMKHAAASMPPGDCPQGVLLGTIRLDGYIDVRRGDQSHGFTHDEQILDVLHSKWRAEDAKFLWSLSEPRLLDAPIPCAGALQLWRVPVEHVAALESLICK